MQVFLNGQFLPETEALIPVSDRGFLYGDGVFETVRVANGRAFRLGSHLERLERGLAFLKIKSRFDSATISRFALELIERNGASESMLRLAVSRGTGVRGYSPRGAGAPTVVMSLHELPSKRSAPKRLITAKGVHAYAADPLARFKTSNKLAHILARMEADEAGADEALLLDEGGHVVEASSGNVFWHLEGRLFTPPVDSGALPGITRGVVVELARAKGIPAAEASITSEALALADGVFLTNSSAGVAECGSLNETTLKRSPSCQELQNAYLDLLARETQR